MNWDKAAQYDRTVFFQGRLDKKLESQKIKLHDNLISLAGRPEDVIILADRKDSNGVSTSKIVKAHIVTNVIFPVLKEVPVRRVSQEFDSGYTIDNLVSAYGSGDEKGHGEDQKDLTTIILRAPLKSEIAVGNKLVKVMVQEGKVNTVMVFDVLEVLADFSDNSPLSMSFRVALSSEPIDPSKSLYQMIMSLAERRNKVGY